MIRPEGVLDPLEAEFGAVLDNLVCELYEAGAIASMYAGIEFGERLTRIYQESGEVHTQYFDFSLPQKSITYDTPMWHGPAVFDVLTALPLLDAVESIIGPEIFRIRRSTCGSRCPKRLPRSIQKRAASSWVRHPGIRMGEW